MKNKNVIGEKLNALLEISQEEMDLCTSIDESFNVTIDYCMIGDIKLSKFTMIMQGIQKNVVEELVEEGVPKDFAIKKLQVDLIDWCQNYVDTFKERMEKNELESEEIFVEQKFLQEVSHMIITWK